MTVALYPGSFDPIHNGHLAVVGVAAALFDEVVVAVGHNPAKPSGLFSPTERIELIEAAIGEIANVRVSSFTGLVTTAAIEHGADCLLKGVRSAGDLDTEMLQAHMNAATSGGIPTVLVPARGPDALVSSRYIREITAGGGDVSPVVPAIVAKRLLERRRS
jgi:pantetheine-phosphate adenylyltransferase